jgi:hypothetical protein
MALRDIRTGEMVDVCRDWLANTKILKAYPLTAPFVSVITAVQNGLAESTKHASAPMPDAERNAQRALLKELDAEWDRAVRVLFGALALLAEAFPDKAAEYAQASAALFPDGLAVVNSSYRNEAGESERIARRVNNDPALGALLKGSTINGVKLTSWYETLVDAGRRMGPIAAKLEVAPERAAEVLREFKARQSWASMVTTLRRTCELAGWSADHMAVFFDQVDRLSSRRAGEGGATAEDPAAVPGPSAPTPTA